MDYMLLIYGCGRADPNGEAPPEKVTAVNAFIEECRARGVYRASSPLRDASTATTVAVRGGEVLMTDGPFAETREQLGGFFLLACRDLDEALELAGRCPMAAEGSIEVRPVLPVPGLAGRPADELNDILGG